MKRAFSPLSKMFNSTTKSVVDLSFILRNTFSSAVTPLTSSGLFTVTGDRWYTRDGKLFGGSRYPGTAVWGDSRIVGPAITHTSGRVLMALVRPEDLESYLAIGYQSSTNQLDPNTGGYGWMNQFGSLRPITPSGSFNIDNSHYDTRPGQYLVTIIMHDDGASVLLSFFGNDIAQVAGRQTPLGVPAYPDARVVWVSRKKLSNTVYPFISALTSPNHGEALHGHTIDDWRIFDQDIITNTVAPTSLYDTFQRSNSTSNPGSGYIQQRGTWGIVSNKLYLSASNYPWDVVYYPTSSSDGFFQWKVTIPASGSFHFNNTFRHNAPGSYVRFTNNGSNNLWYLQTFVNNGYQSSIVSGAQDWVAGQEYLITIIAIGNKYFVSVNDIVKTANWISDPDSYYTTATGIGVGQLEGAMRWGLINYTPMTVSLPVELRKGAMPVQKTFTTLSVQDTFTNTNGTAIASHTESGKQWTAALGTAVIENNKLVLNGSDQILAVQDVGSVSNRCEVSVTLPSSITRWVFAGIVTAYVNPTNWMCLRMAADLVAQPNDCEIEVMRCVDGIVDVTGKVQFGNYYVPNRVITIASETQFDSHGDELFHVYLDGNPVQTYYLPVTLRGTTKRGLYRSNTDAGSVFDDWKVYI